MEMPKLTPAHYKLERMVGEWLGREHIRLSPFDPNGGDAVGRVSNRRALDGFAVVQDYQQERQGTVSLRGHAVIRWDAGEQCYIMYWFDSVGMPPNEFRGDFAGDVLVLTNQAPQGQTRATFDYSDPDLYQYRMDVSPDGNQWFPFMTGEYVRDAG